MTLIGGAWRGLDRHRLVALDRVAPAAVEAGLVPAGLVEAGVVGLAVVDARRLQAAAAGLPLLSVVMRVVVPSV